MEMNEAALDIYNEENIHQFQPGNTQNSAATAEAPSLKISSHGTSRK